MPLIIRLEDTSDHGGEVITAAAKTYAEGKKIARKDDILDCPIHGQSPIVEASENYLVEGKGVARHGDKTECGASLISSALKTKAN
jgi:uncharacterized Zn-binding protein involved in type VI secretion